MTREDKIEKLSYLYTQWNTLGKKKLPFHFEIEREHQTLYYFGANHSRDPKDFQYEELYKYWDAFLSKVDAKNSAVLIEGGMRKLRENEDDAITKSSEAGLLIFLSNKQGISVESPDPKEILLIPDLLKKFSKEEIEYYHFARMILQWHRLIDPKPSFDDYLTKSLHSDKESMGWSDFEFTIDNMKKVHQIIFRTEFDENNQKFFEDNVISVRNNSIINSVARFYNILRDAFVIERIEELWNEKKNIFAAFGMIHPVMQEFVLREVLK